MLLVAAALAVLLQVEATCPYGADCPAVLSDAAVRIEHAAQHVEIKREHGARVTRVQLNAQGRRFCDASG